MLRKAAQAAGSRITLLLSFAILGTGHFFGWSETWWTWIDRAVYLLTMWLAMVVQSAQNRDTAALQSKIDEVIRAIPEADNRLRGLEKQQIVSK